MIFYFTAFLLVAIAIITINQHVLRKRTKKITKEIRDNWGKPKIDSFYNFDLIDRYFLNRIEFSDSSLQIIPEKVAEDLNLNSVFKAIDRTTSRIGQQYLYFKLRIVGGSVSHLKAFDSLISKFEASETLRTNGQVLLYQLNKVGTYYFEDLIHGDKVKKPRFFFFVFLLSFISLSSLIASFIYSKFLLLFFIVFTINAIIHYWNKKNLNLHLSSLTQYLKAYNTAKNLYKQDEIRNHYNHCEFLKGLSPLNRRMKFINLIATVENDQTSIAYLIAELLKIMLNLEVLVFYTVIDSVRQKADLLNQLFAFIGEIDSAISVASFRKGLANFCKPDFEDSKHLKVQDLAHPLISPCTTNNLELDNSSLLLTGSNMSGKTQGNRF